jgi:hypothetical protein
MSGLSFTEIIKMKPFSFLAVSKYFDRKWFLSRCEPQPLVPTKQQNVVLVPGMQNVNLGLEIGCCA